MRCDICGRVATYHSIEVINGVKEEHHLCSDCASSYRDEQDFMPLTVPSIGEFFDFPLSFKPKTKVIKKVLRCPKCGCTSEDFLNKGKLGCSECYKYLHEVVDPAIDEVLSNNDMPDKISLNESINKDIPLANDLTSLTEQLKIAVKEERYEDASRLKAQIDKLKQS